MNYASQHAVALAFALAAGLSLGCGDDDGGTSAPDASGEPDQVTVNDFVGSWQASSHLYTNNADETEQLDVIENDGETRMTVLVGGRARTWLTIGDFSDEWDALITVDGATLTSTPAETTRPVRVYEFTLDGVELTLLDTDSEFDFTGTDATPVSATVRIAMTRQ